MMDLYASAAPSGLRALLVMEELEFAYRLHLVDLKRREQDSVEFRRLNPLGQVPVLVDPEGPACAPITLLQSGAIIHYLAGKAGRLVPQNEAARVRAQQLTWMVLTDIAAASTAIFLGSRLEVPSDGPLVQVFRERLRSALSLFNKELAGCTYLCGELSVADFAFLPLVLLPHVVAAMAEADTAHVERWKQNMLARPSVARSLAKAGHH